MCMLRVLGPLELGPPEGDGRAAPTSPRLRRLLAALALRAGRTVSADALAEAVWPGDRPERPAAALQTLVSRLRAALAELDGVELVTRSPGYALTVPDGELDARTFERLAAEGSALVTTDPAAATQVLDRALVLWRGAPYAELADDDVARAEAARLEELRKVALEDRVDAALALGRHHEVAARLESLVAAEPLRERRRAQLMLARHRAGRTADALQGYREFRSLLEEELGIDPSDGLRQLHEAILRDDPSLGWAPPAGPPHAASQPLDPRQRGQGQVLPVTTLIGREQELAAVAELLHVHPVLTLTGPGGVGKTSLAVAAADAAGSAYPDGTWVVALAAAGEPDAVPLAVASALDVPAGADATPLERVVRWLSGRRALLLVDNCEHLPDAVAELVAALRRGAPTVSFLLTSQRPVAAVEEQVFPVGPLGTEDASPLESAAVQLFATRARAQDPAFSLDDPQSVAEICRRLDGLPLAIELAAAKMAAMAPAELAARLSGRFRLLHGGTRTAEQRHRTLRAMVDWSYGLLDPLERRAFESLSVLVGSFTLERAERLLVAMLAEESLDEAGAADLVLRLVERSMVVSRPGAPTAYTILETLRAYAGERLRERGLEERARKLHAEQVAELVVDFRLDLTTSRHLAAVERLGSLLDEIRAAFGWAIGHDRRSAARIVAGAALLLEHRMTAEVADWAERLWERLGRTDGMDGLSPDEVAWAALAAASGARFSGDLESGSARAARAAGLAREPMAVCYAAYLQGEIALFQGDAARAAPFLGQVEDEARSAGLDSFGRLVRLSRALDQANRGDPDGAAALASGVEAEARAAGEPVNASWATYARGEILLERDPAGAVPLLESALEQATATGDHYLTGVTLVSLASACARAGDPATALPLFRRAVEHWHRSGDWTHQWTTLRNVVVLLVRLDRHDGAAVVDGAVVAHQGSTAPYGPEAERMRRTRERLVAHLGKAGYDEAARAGAGLGHEALVAFVCDQLT